MKSRKLFVCGLLAIMLVSLGFIHSFVAAVSADCTKSNDGDNDTYTCTNDNDGDPVDTGDGDDSVTADNSTIGDIDLGNDNDSGTVRDNSYVDGDLDGGNNNDRLDVSGHSTVDGDVLGGNGDDTITIQDSRLNDNAEGGGGNDRITVADSFVSSNVDGDGGDDTIRIIDSGNIYDVTGDNGNDDISVTGDSTLYGKLKGGEGNDTLVVGADIRGDSDPNAVEAGEGDDVVTLVDGAKLDAALSGGGGFDVLKFKFTVGSQGEKDAFQKLLDQQAPAGGFVDFNGQTFSWNGFEQLQNLLRVLHAEGASVTITVLGDSRLNRDEVAGPIAVYCNAGSIEIWVIAADGHGDLGLRTVESALPQSVNGIDVARSGDQITAGYSGYTYSFPAIICPG